MGENSLATRSSGQEIQASDVNQYLTALSVNHVPRKSNGSPFDQAGDIGTPLLQWGNIIFAGNLVKNGQVVQILSFGSGFQISDGEKEVDGHSAFLEFVASSTSITIAATTTNLKYIVNGNSITLDIDTIVSSLSLAPSTNNTALVDDASLIGQDVSKYLGESHLKFISIDTIGTEITSVNGKVKAFKQGSEIFLAHVDTTNNRLWSFKRGIAKTEREVLNDDDVITLLQLNAIFLDEDATTTYKTINYPTWLTLDPGGASAGDWNFNTTTNNWKKFSGSVWEITDAIFLGIAILDDTEVIGVEHQDFDLSWQSENEGQVRFVDSNTIQVTLRNTSIAGRGKSSQDFGQEMVMGTDMEPGEIETAGTVYYIYMDLNERLYFSTKRPRLSDKKNGSYHPFRYWRYMSEINNDSSSNISIFDQKQLVKRWEDEMRFDSNASEEIDLQPVTNLVSGGFIINTTFNKTDADKIIRFSISGRENNAGSSTSKIKFIVGSLNREWNLSDNLFAESVGKNKTDSFDISKLPSGSTTVQIQYTGGGNFTGTGGVFKNGF